MPINSTNVSNSRKQSFLQSKTALSPPKKSEHPAEKFIFRLKICIFRLKTCISRLEICISSLEMQLFSAKGSASSCLPCHFSRKQTQKHPFDRILTYRLHPAKANIARFPLWSLGHTHAGTQIGSSEPFSSIRPLNTVSLGPTKTHVCSFKELHAG